MLCIFYTFNELLVGFTCLFHVKRELNTQTLLKTPLVFFFGLVFSIYTLYIGIKSECDLFNNSTDFFNVIM